LSGIEISGAMRNFRRTARRSSSVGGSIEKSATSHGNAVLPWTSVWFNV